MDLKTSAAVLCDVHTTERDGIAGVQIGARPEFFHDMDRYVEAWLTLLEFALKPASPEPPTTPADAPRPE